MERNKTINKEWCFNLHLLLTSYDKRPFLYSYYFLVALKRWFNSMKKTESAPAVALFAVRHENCLMMPHHMHAMFLLIYNRFWVTVLNHWLWFSPNKLKTKIKQKICYYHTEARKIGSLFHTAGHQWALLFQPLVLEKKSFRGQKLKIRAETCARH